MKTTSRSQKSAFNRILTYLLISFLMIPVNAMAGEAIKANGKAANTGLASNPVVFDGNQMLVNPSSDRNGDDDTVIDGDDVKTNNDCQAGKWVGYAMDVPLLAGLVLCGYIYYKSQEAPGLNGSAAAVADAYRPAEKIHAEKFRKKMLSKTDVMIKEHLYDYHFTGKGLSGQINNNINSEKNRVGMKYFMEKYADDKLGSGVEKNVYKYGDKAVAIRKKGRGDNIRSIEETVRIINSIEMNKEAGFKAEYLNQNSFSMPLCEEVSYEEFAKNENLIRDKMTKSGYYMWDFNSSNILKYKGQYIVADIGETASLDEDKIDAGSVKINKLYNDMIDSGTRPNQKNLLERKAGYVEKKMQYKAYKAQPISQAR